MSTHRASRRNAAFRKGFTLIEILVVLAIAAIITSITVGGFKEMSAGNKRVSCQSNLAQIYQSCRMYASDEGGKFPYYNFTTPDDCNTTSRGIGLWSLYTFPDAGDVNATPSAIPADPNSPAPLNRPGPPPIERYIRSDKVLHCPNDYATGHGNLFSPVTNRYNPEYLSYQSCDNGIPTYASVRTTIDTDPKKPWKRQLMNYSGAATTPVPRPPDDKTIVTWCQFHRGSRDFDNVLFYDGSVQLLPRSQPNPDSTAPSPTDLDPLKDWRRKPKTPQ